MAIFTDICVSHFSILVSFDALRHNIAHDKPSTLAILIIIQASALSAVLHVIVLTGNGLNC